MPRATLSFTLPEEAQEFELAQKGGSYSHVLWELDQSFFRANIKYGLKPELKQKIVEEVYDKDTQEKIAKLDQELVDTVIEATLQACRSQMFEYCKDNDVELF